MHYPSTKSNSVLHALLLGAFALASIAIPAQAANYLWSPGGSYNTGGSGTWSTSAANWSSDGGSSFINWANNNTPIFGGTDGTPGQYVISIAAGYTAAGITFNNSGYILQSDGVTLRTISVGSSPITVAAGKTATVGNLARISNGNANLTGGGTLRIAAGGSLNGGQGLAVSTSSTLHIDGGDVTYVNFSHGSGTNTTTISSGTMNVTNGTVANGNGFVLADSSGSTSTLNLDGGTFNTVRIYRRSGTGNVNFNGGTFQLRSGAAETAATSFLSANNAFVKEGGVIIDSNGYNGFTAQVFQHGGVAPTDGGLTKNGLGRITLSGASTYTGATTINAGSLLINGSIAAASDVMVNTGGTLGGSGTINGATTIASGGTLAPGNSPGVTTFTDELLLSTGSNFQFELIGNTEAGRGTNFDGVNLTGAGSALTIQSGVTANLVFNGTGSTVLWGDAFWNTDRSWLVFDSEDAPTLVSGAIFDAIQVGLDSVGSSAAGSFSFSEDLNGDIYLNYTAVPEPSSAALVVLAGLLLLGRRRESRI